LANSSLASQKNIKVHFGKCEYLPKLDFFGKYWHSQLLRVSGHYLVLLQIKRLSEHVQIANAFINQGCI